MFTRINIIRWKTGRLLTFRFILKVGVLWIKSERAADVAVGLGGLVGSVTAGSFSLKATL